MNTNNYFLIKKDLSENTFNIIEGPIPLPSVFLNTSGFNSLEFSNPELLKNLYWLEREDLGFWLGIFSDKPTVNYYKKIVTNNIIDSNNQVVNVTYTEVDLTEQEIEAKNLKMRASYVPVRDSYLKLTDFTQLPDAPITEQARIDFAIFRQQLRAMFNITDYSQLAWPPNPTSAPNITIPPFPIIDFS